MLSWIDVTYTDGRRGLVGPLTKNGVGEVLTALESDTEDAKVLTFREGLSRLRDQSKAKNVNWKATRLRRMS